eukprot:TRINITY_DN762_c0_g1_i1.p1 TRINITY_DN762_c0_g1~~TRINITY_DN762_c0_g1_i1.p1  ORF type:complete len:391 (-),score=121.26 TRINITY_DN762_c0_g1_i1:97-1185(-)
MTAHDLRRRVRSRAMVAADAGIGVGTGTGMHAHVAQVGTGTGAHAVAPPVGHDWVLIVGKATHQGAPNPEAVLEEQLLTQRWGAPVKHDFTEKYFYANGSELVAAFGGDGAKQSSTAYKVATSKGIATSKHGARYNLSDANAQAQARKLGVVQGILKASTTHIGHPAAAPKFMFIGTGGSNGNVNFARNQTFKGNAVVAVRQHDDVWTRLGVSYGTSACSCRIGKHLKPHLKFCWNAANTPIATSGPPQLSGMLIIRPALMDGSRADNLLLGNITAVQNAASAVSQAVLAHPHAPATGVLWASFTANLTKFHAHYNGAAYPICIADFLYGQVGKIKYYKFATATATFVDDSVAGTCAAAYFN